MWYILVRTGKTGEEYERRFFGMNRIGGTEYGSFYIR